VPEGLTLRVYNASHFIVLSGRLRLISSHRWLFYGLTVGDEFDGEAFWAGGIFSEFPTRPWTSSFLLSSEITLRSAQVRRISWVRRVRPAGARLSGLLVSAAFRPATKSNDHLPSSGLWLDGPSPQAVPNLPATNLAWPRGRPPVEG